MWSKYNCQKFSFNRDDKKIIKTISDILNNKTVNITIKLMLTIISGLIIVGKFTMPITLEILKMADPKRFDEPKDIKDRKFLNTSFYFDTLLSSMKLVEVSISNAIKLDKKIKEVNPNSSFLESIFNLKFNGDFDEFEKECDNIFNKETYEYSANELAILYLVLSDGLNTCSNDIPLPSLLNLPLIAGAREAYLESQVKEKKLEYMTFNEKGQAVYNIKDDEVKKKIKELTDSWNYYRTNKYTNQEIVERCITGITFRTRQYNIVTLEQQTPAVQGGAPAHYATPILRRLLDVDPNNVETLYVDMVELIAECFNHYHFKRGDFSIGTGTQSTSLWRLINSSAKNRIGGGAVVTPLEVYQDIYKQVMSIDVLKDFNSSNKLTQSLIAFLPLNLFVEKQISTLSATNIVPTKAEKDEQIDGLRNFQNLQFNKIMVFYSVTKSYDFIKLMMSGIIPKRFITLLFDIDSSYSILDEVLSIVAGVLLGPKYLAREVSGETAKEIIDSYIKMESMAPDPFITKYMEEQKFVKEEKKEEDKFNIFITNKDFVELQKEQYEERVREGIAKERMTGGVRFKKGEKSNVMRVLARNSKSRSIYPPRSQSIRGGELKEDPEPTLIKVDEDAIKNKINMVLGKNSRVIEEVLNKETTQYTPNERIALLTGVLSGDILENNLSSPVRDKIHQLLCYLSSNVGAITRLRSQLTNMTLAFMYLMSKLNANVIILYKKFAKETGKSLLSDFSKHLRYSQQRGVIEKLIEKQL